MEINFTTENIDEKQYEKLILHYIYEHYHYTDFKRLMLQDNWKIIIKSVDESNVNFYSKYEKQFLSNRIPHGVTGKNEIIVYVLDVNNSMITLQNFTAIYHECAHMILKIYYKNKRVTQRHDDFYSKKGNKRNLFSSEIHDRSIEGKFRQVKNKINFRSSINLIGIDITDLTNSRKSFLIK